MSKPTFRNFASAGLAAVVLPFAASGSDGVAPARDALALSGKWGVGAKEWGESNVVWRSFKATVPADWAGRRIRVEIPGALHKCDAVVFVNGERAGDILRPGFEGVEATHLVKFGEENEMLFCLTESGAETARGETKAVTRLHRAKKGPAGENPRLAAYPDVFVNDVFANTSWRKKRCDFEIEIDGGNGNVADAETSPVADANSNLRVEVFDSASNLVWRGEKEIAPAPGRSVHVLSMPWDDKIVAWELGRPALYTARISIRDSASERDETAVRFGFREVWRDGREIMMNGHKAHFRPVYSYGARKAGSRFLQGIGYNVMFNGHSRDAIGVVDEALFRGCDETGMGVVANVGAYDTLGADVFHKDPAMREEFRRFAATCQRLVRNHPSLVVGIIGNMSKTDSNWGPAALAHREAAGDRAEQIALARELHREANPGILYLSHADGPVADIDNGNVYLNWTPMQEQEEWLVEWAKTGTMPWCSIEFLSPFYGDFVQNNSLFLGTEYLAMLHGDRAYEAETDGALAGTAEAVRQAKYFGSPAGNELLRANPLFLELYRQSVWRNNSRWRAFGLNGGNIWFNLGDGYGDPPGFTGSHYGRYAFVTDDPPGKPSWANWFYDVHRLGNLDFCGFVGGAPDFADRTHAYFAGEKIEKQLVLIWDGVGEKTVTAKWDCSQLSANADCPTTANANDPVNPVEESSASSAPLRLCVESKTCIVAQGEQARIPVSFSAPEVAERTAFRLTATFTGEGIEPFTDTFDFEVWPKANDGRRVTSDGRRVAVLDPLGTAAPILDALGIGYRAIDSVADLPADATHLVVGRDALLKQRLDPLAPRVAAGLRVFVMRQTPDTWRKMGFQVQDLMLREVFPRDPAFKTLPQDALREWRGVPDYPNAPYGALMRHSSRRGPHGTRRHAVAGLALQVPERVGYLPLIVGGFDLDYAALLSFEDKITYCTLDFEGRVGVDPAATETAKAAFGEFLAGGSGGEAPRCSLVVCDEARAVAEGFSVGAETNVFRAAIPDSPAFRGVGPNDVRWPTGLSIRPLRGEGATPDGAFAVKRRADGSTLVFSQVPEGRFAARAADGNPLANAERLDEGRVRRLYARLRTNCTFGGAAESQPSARLRRALHQSGLAEFEPLPAMHLLGPFSAGKDDSRLMLDTVWSEQGEAMAIAGDFDPNQDFPLPQGGTANWRPMIVPDADGTFDFAAAQPAASFPVTYAICNVRRDRDGNAAMKLGFDWRGRVWCNGREVFRAEYGANYPRYEVSLPLKTGDNVLAFKVGAGSGGHRLFALLESERPAEEGFGADPALDAMTLYDDDVPGFDPYTFRFW